MKQSFKNNKRVLIEYLLVIDSNFKNKLEVQSFLEEIK